jgi:hypothetical protein
MTFFVQDRRAHECERPLALKVGLVETDAAVGSECVADVLVGHLAVEPLGIEVAAGPAFGFAVLEIFGVGDDVEEGGVDILGRSGAGAVDAAGGARLRIEGEEPLEFDDVLPVVAKVVNIEKTEVFSAIEVEEAHGALIEAARVAFEFRLTSLGIAVGQAADPEFVKVAIPPAEGGLDDAVQLAEVESDRHDKAAPDWRLDPDKRDADLNGVRFVEAHASEYAGIAPWRGVNGSVAATTPSHDGAGRGCCACIQSAARCALLAAVKTARGSSFRSLSHAAI